MAGDSSMSILLGAGLTLLSTAATFSVSLIEECLKAYHRSDLFRLLGEGPRAEAFEAYLKRHDEHLVVARLARPFAYLAGFVGMLFVVSGGHLEFRIGEVIESMLATVLLAVLFAGVIPYAVARHNPEGRLIRWLPVYDRFARLFGPLLMLADLLHVGVAKARGQVEETPEQEFEDEIADSLEEAERDGVISENERQMISSVIDFADGTVSDALTPRTEMICIDVTQSVGQAMAAANEHGHSRLPVFEESRDNIVGVFYVRDALRYWQKRDDALPPLRSMMRKPMYVPEHQKLDVLLAEFRKRNMEVAIVLDEYGGTAGMITLEDLLEEIVGDLRDEFDPDEERDSHASIVRVDEETIEVDARIRIGDLNDIFGCELPESEEYSSLAGLISARAERIPGPGEQVVSDGVVLTVVEANQRQIRKVRVSRAPAMSGEADRFEA